MFVLLTLNVDCVNCFAVVYEVFISIQSIVNCSKSLFNNYSLYIQPIKKSINFL